MFELHQLQQTYPQLVILPHIAEKERQTALDSAMLTADRAFRGRMPSGLGLGIGAAIPRSTGVPILRVLPGCYEPSAAKDVVKSDNFCNLLQKLGTLLPEPARIPQIPFTAISQRCKRLGSGTPYCQGAPIYDR